MPQDSSTRRVSTTFPPDVTIAVVTHNSARSLPGVIEAITATGCPDTHLIVVDVASTDDALARLRAGRPAIRAYQLEKNEGPNPARNEALRLSETPFVLLMDADVLLQPTTVQALRPAMDASDVRVATPVVLHAARPDVIQYAGGGVHYICEAVNAWQERPLVDRGHAPADVGAAPGCALLIERRAAADVGGFDERYFMGKEDGDFLHRIRIAGYRIREVPDACVLHQSRPRSTWLFEYQLRNRWHFLLRNYQLRTLLLLAPALAVHEGLQFSVLAVKGHLGAWARAVRGLGRMMPALGADRAAVGRYRRAGDAHLLRSDPLVVRDDLAGGRLGAGLKSTYDAWLRGYWRIIRPLLDQRRAGLE
jgi:GT2 family glycosyltransferase